MAKKYIRKVGLFNTNHTTTARTIEHSKMISHINLTFKAIQSSGVFSLEILGVCQTSNNIAHIIFPVLYTTKSTSYLSEHTKNPKCILITPTICHSS